eukprot:TRINITY_DN20312_c0_g1_i1.p1 TRINITY_DN20312_c0_g1~~TRINITY_DN20312_c0_g1_i1.p1  ORF type:complete len:146 (-),score=35.47 TRINITY_DN20312_c0_g1_i1:26-463(-)
MGHAEVVKELLSRNANIDTRLIKSAVSQIYIGCDSLMIACDKGHLPVVKILVQNNAKIYSESQNGWKGIDYARATEKNDIVEYLTNIEEIFITSEFPKNFSNYPIKYKIMIEEILLISTYFLLPNDLLIYMISQILKTIHLIKQL